MKCQNITSCYLNLYLLRPKYVLIIDLRPRDEAAKGFIKGAVSIPMQELAAVKKSFPANKKAPVILYSDKQASRAAFNIVRGWGYKNTTLLKGGAQAWTGRFFQGEPATEIVYIKRLKPGQISIDEFKNIAKNKPADKLILDVRDSGAAGYISGAMSVPLSDIKLSLEDIPKDKEIIVHCNTGIMASMALKTLSDSGYKTRYLNAVVQVSPDGSFEITEK